MIHLPTQKFGERASGAYPKYLIIHSIGLPLDTALTLLTTAPLEVSVHYLITPDGTIFSMVPEEKRAWHAGKSMWQGESDINSFSIGIELAWSLEREADPEDLPGPFPEAQMSALISLAKSIQARWNVLPENILAHSDVSPARKRDPGEQFDWKRMADEGLGVFPVRPYPFPPDGDISAKLQRIGYDVTDLPAALVAFQRHYRPRACDGVADSETRSILQWLCGVLKR